VVLLANKENDPEKENVWYLDTGASNHMCGYKYMFTELKEEANGHVSFGDASKVRVEGEGNILIKPNIIGENRYFITFIDDFSHKTWVYFLKKKSEAFAIFKKFKVFIEKKSGFYIKVLRSDRGGEFISAAFNSFYEEHDIRRHLTAPYSPQQNGVAERKNRIILDMVRSMLKSKNMPKEFWAEAVDCAVYLLNWCKTSSFENITPQEAWSGFKPSVSHLKVFDSVAYAHISD
jgi:transposase InsO family protein